MATPLVVYRRVLGERFATARLGPDATLDSAERSRLRDALLEHYDDDGAPVPLDPGELRPCVDLPAPMALAAPSDAALAAVLDPMALRREMMATPLKRAVLAGTRVLLADPVARLLTQGDGKGTGADGAQLIAALGLLTQLAPLIEEGIVLLASPQLATSRDDPTLAAAAHWAADAARLRDRPGWRAIRAGRDAAFDRFATASEFARLLGAFDRAAALGAPAHAVLSRPEAERTTAAALGDLFWALSHYDLGEIDQSPLTPLDVETLGERRRDGAIDRPEPVCGVADAPFGHVGRLVSAVWPAPGAIALEEIVAMRLGEEAFEDWRGLVGDWLRETVEASDESADPRAAPSSEMRERFEDWERRTAERFARMKAGRAVEAARDAGQHLAVGVALASRPSAVARAVSGAQGGAQRLDTALTRAIMAETQTAASPEPTSPPALGAYLAETRRTAG